METQRKPDVDTGDGGVTPPQVPQTPMETFYRNRIAELERDNVLLREQRGALAATINLLRREVDETKAALVRTVAVPVRASTEDRDAFRWRVVNAWMELADKTHAVAPSAATGVREALNDAADMYVVEDDLVDEDEDTRDHLGEAAKP